MIVLGRFYTRTLVTTANHTVVRSGPYRVIRHPGYLGSVMTWTGAALVLAPLLIAALVSAILMLAYVRRVHHEEHMLTDRFGICGISTWNMAIDPFRVLNTPTHRGTCQIP